MQNNDIKYQAFLTILAIIWTLGVIVASIMPFSSANDITLWAHLDKVVHFIFYFVATILWLAAGYRSWQLLLALSALGWVIEWIQHMSGWRSGDLYDGLMNMTGVFCAWAMIRLCRL